MQEDIAERHLMLGSRSPMGRECGRSNRVKRNPETGCTTDTDAEH
jgi:hypothetical protein